MILLPRAVRVYFATQPVDAARKRLDRILDGMPAEGDECDLSASGSWWV